MNRVCNALAWFLSEAQYDLASMLNVPIPRLIQSTLRGNNSHRRSLSSARRSVTAASRLLKTYCSQEGSSASTLAPSAASTRRVVSGIVSSGTTAPSSPLLSSVEASKKRLLSTMAPAAAGTHIAAARPPAGAVIEDLEKPVEDHRLYRYFTLPNGMQACAVSDHKCDKASACLSVRVGSLFEPKKIPGLAHFCEHMLFLGTKKYPREDDYNEFLAKNGGHSNAFTAGTQTVYYFDVAKEHLEGALDRFAQFFLEPLFTETATERELKAVHSEHTKNMQSDRWRRNQLMKNMFNPDHVLNQFATGNMETLHETPTKENIDLRQNLLDFHAKYYSSNVMTVSILGHQSLDELQALITEKFANVTDNNVDIPRGEAIGKGVAPMVPGSLQTEQYIVPVKDEKSVSFQFLLPEQYYLWKTKPTKYLSHMLGHEGKGSLFAKLKEQGLATDLCAGQAFDEAGVCFFAVDIQLTEKGENEVPLVGEMLFSYIDLLRSETSKVDTGAVKPEDSVLHKVFREMQCVDEMSFKFRSLSNPTSAVSNLAQGLQEIEVPPEKVLSAHAKIWEYDPKLVHSTLSHFTLDKLQVTKVGAKYEDMCTEQEHWYGTKHSKLLPLDRDCTLKWSKPQDFGLELFHPNPFIAEKLDFKAYSGAQKPEAPPQRYVIQVPQSESSTQGKESSSQAINQRGLHLYHKQDQLFRLPKAYVVLNLYSPYTSASPENMLKTELWSQSLAEELNEYSYDAELAGLMYKMGADTRGIYLQVAGYDDKLNVLLAAVSDRIAQGGEVNQKTFDLVYERFHRDLLNASLKRQPYEQALSWRNRVMTKNHRTFGEKLAILVKLKREDLTDIQEKVFDDVHVEGLAMGNLSKPEVKDALVKDFLNRTLTPSAPSSSSSKSNGTAKSNGTFSPKSRTTPVSDHIAPMSTFFLKPGKAVGMRLVGTNPDETNGSSILSLQVGKTSVETWMKTSLYAQIVSQKFFDELRTKQQLGYIVASQAVKNAQKTEVLYLVQSEVAPSVCTQRILDFCKLMQTEYFVPASSAESNKDTTPAPAGEEEKASHITEALFDEYRQALVVQLEEKPKKLSDEFAEHWNEVRERTNDFDRRERSIAFLKQLKYEDFLTFAQSISPEVNPSVSVELVPENLKDQEMALPPIKVANMDTVNFKSTAEIDAFFEKDIFAGTGEWLHSNTKIDKPETMSKL
ncbi:unnamed protein product [Amoebophrya sp. A120]|nr:unnamed protein product [Amoebophrya sp. A120]|eukprot:GSA120T00011316001.1